MADQDNHQHADGIDRRGFLPCIAWAGTGLDVQRWRACRLCYHVEHERYGKGAIGKGWQSFDYLGVHFQAGERGEHSAVAGKHRLFHRHSATYNPDGTL